MDKHIIDEVLTALSEAYPLAAPQLNYNNPFELLIAAILSAQCTDKRVNIVTETLFVTYPDAVSFAEASLLELENSIRTCGLYHSKAKNIIAACRIIVDKHGGAVPDSIDELTALPGVGRKVANVVLSNAFGIPAIAVDTHVFRVSNRIGLASGKTPMAVEKQLMDVIPKQLWGTAHHWLIFHGRQCCHAKKPQCGVCSINKYCEFEDKSEDKE